VIIEEDNTISLINTEFESYMDIIRKIFRAKRIGVNLLTIKISL